MSKPGDTVYLTLPNLARELRLDARTLRSRLDDSPITPDAHLFDGAYGIVPLFNVVRLEEIRAAVRAPIALRGAEVGISTPIFPVRSPAPTNGDDDL